MLCVFCIVCSTNEIEQSKLKQQFNGKFCFCMHICDLYPMVAFHMYEMTQTVYNKFGISF